MIVNAAVLPFLALALVLGGAPLAEFAPTEIAQTLGYVAVSDGPSKPFCNEDPDYYSTELLCAHKPSVVTTHWRPKAKLKDTTWTVRLDVVALPSEAEAARAREELVAFVGSRAATASKKTGRSQPTLSWCPRSYFWWGKSIVVVSVTCGAVRPMCAISRGLADALLEREAEGPWGILGFEGGCTVLVRDLDAFAKCRCRGLTAP